MHKWSDSTWIKNELQKKWDSGRLLKAMLNEDGLFPMSIPLKKPNSSEINSNFADVSYWIKRLKDGSKIKTNHGYELREKEINHRQSGRNKLPTHAIIPTVNDALMIIKKSREASRFMHLVQMIQSEFPSLREWIEKYPLKVLRHADDWLGILAVLRWFDIHHRSGLYMRQLDIAGVDTKFIENRKGILTELLFVLLPDGSINQEGVSFEQRFGLREKPVRVRLRLLDHGLFLHGISDLTIPVEQVMNYRPAVLRVFITENEINGLCFPDVEKSMVIFGLGYGVDILKSIEWLTEKDIYYWGDIDTHGFAMLDQVRAFLPQTESILMCEDALLSNRDMWTREKEPFYGTLSRLTEDEDYLFNSLKDNVWGENIRLEQERIAYKSVESKVMEKIYARSG